MPGTRAAGLSPRPAELRLLEVSRDYGGITVLHPVSLTVLGGTCVALMGPNGSGKSTLLRLATGREEPTTGEVLLDGRVLRDDEPRTRSRLAVVADSPSFYPDLTVREHLQLVATAHGVGAERDRLVDAALADRRLSEHAEALPGALSSGQVQALLLAAALVRPRDVLVLDEPEQRLDPGARDRLAQRIAAEKQSGVAVLLATHHEELAAAAADHVVRLDAGHVVAADAAL